MNLDSCQPLLVDDYLEEIQRLVQIGNLVLVAEPGAGKTSRVPSALLRTLPGKVLVLQPRRMAAVAAANRVAKENQWEVGREVGYQVRFDSCLQAETRLIFMTEAMLAKKLMSDPELRDVAVVVLDEFHERSVSVDLSLGMLREAQMLGARLKILVMSATVDASSISQYLGEAPILSVPGKLFPLTIEFDTQSQSLRLDDVFFQRLVRRTGDVVRKTNGDTLVFLPGVSEILRALRVFDSWKDEFDLVSLHGSLGLTEQQQVLTRSFSGHQKRRLIFTTNLAESSVTVDGVDAVVDSGLQKVQEWDFESGFENLSLGRISKSSATQRAGRAARQRGGLCFRLWTPMEDRSLPDFMLPEVLRTDLSEAGLWLAAMGVGDFSKFSWFQAPSAVHLAAAAELLNEIGATTSEGRITPKGVLMSQVPLPPRLAGFFVDLVKAGFPDQAAKLCALLNEKDLWPNGVISSDLAVENDWLARLEAWHDSRRPREEQPWVRSSSPSLLGIERVAQQLERIAAVGKARRELSREAFYDCLFANFPDRLCRRRRPNENSAVSVRGKGVSLGRESLVTKSEFFVALRGGQRGSKEVQVSWAAGVPSEWLMSEIADRRTKQRFVKWDYESGKVWVEESSYFKKMPLNAGVVVSGSPDEVEVGLREMLLAHWEEFVRSVPALELCLKKWEVFVRGAEDESLQFTSERKLELLRASLIGVRSLAEARGLDWSFHFLNLWPTVSRRFIDSMPSQVKIGSAVVPVQIGADGEPFVEIRLRKAYGTKVHPIYGPEKLPIRMVLLGPHGRPIQITKDLSGFWAGSYKEVRKDLRGDYPRHPWPDDPASFVDVPPPKRNRD